MKDEDKLQTLLDVRYKLIEIDQNIKNMHKRFNEYGKGNFDVEEKYPWI